MSDTKRIFLTGGRGMVGRNICDLAAKDSRIEIDAPSRSQLDLADAGAVASYLKETKPDVIVHAAGRVGGIRANMAAPVAFLSENIAMGQNLLLAARAADIGQVINLGSSCMYPREGENPLREELILSGPLEPTNEGYALAKIATMRLGQYMNREDGFERVKTMIPCNLYGPHDTFDPIASHLIPAILMKMHDAQQEGKETVEIWGTGEARREFMYAGDAAAAVLRAVFEFDSMPEEMNVGLGHDYTINEYYETAAEMIGWQGRFEHDLDKPVGMMRKLVSTERQTAWGWQPETSLNEGLRLTYDYFLKDVLS